ncbi:MAG: UDP-N-acetylenolpyruvoylglucosamine reductase, partial [Nanoarchaeota archaeon]
VPQKLLKQLKDSIKNDPFPILPTAKLLALAGLKGKKQGEAMVSQKHPNFIVNLGRATSKDVQKLIKEIKEIIKEKYGIELEEEITIL